MNNTPEEKDSKNGESAKNDQLIADILNVLNSKEDAAQSQETTSESDSPSPTEENHPTRQLHKNSEEYTSAVPMESSQNMDKKPYRQKRRRRKRSVGRAILVIVLLVAIFTIAIWAASIILKIGSEVMGIGKDDSAITVTIPTGAGTEEIAQILEDKNIIVNSYIFRAFSRLQHADGTYQSGEHTVRPNMSYDALIVELQSEPPQETVDVTFPEGKTLIQCAEILEENGVCDVDEFLSMINTNSFEFDFEDMVLTEGKFYKMEGYCFPDTYRFYVDSDPELVVQKILRNFQNKIDPYMEMIENSDLSLDEIITLASIVQAEAPVFEEMSNVSSVFWNRLNNPSVFPKLESDPTRKYGEDVISQYALLPNPTMIDAYNTYVSEGLPPGPICNPGEEAIRAVLDPTDTDYYFFCSNLQTREFFYATTNAEHEENLVRANLK